MASSMMLSFLTIIVLCRLSAAALISVYHINQRYLNNDNYNTSHSADCLYYYVPVNIDDYKRQKSQMPQQQIIAYCLEEQNVSITNIPTSNQRESYTFEQLHQQNITIEQLYSWSTSIDLVEDYAIYLNNRQKSTEASNKTFYNCSLDWFGQMCQYTFTKRLSPRQPTFIDIVTEIFHMKSPESSMGDKYSLDNYTLYSCYIHLKCERDQLADCLDWREICDGKVDCLNDGPDEMFCAQLEMHDCAENEYRCHNGAQCIPIEMFNDDEFNPDCLDGTDESEDLLTTICVTDPSFHCEEQSCRYPLMFSCGDGQCIRIPFLFALEVHNYERFCLNGRDRYIREITLSLNANSFIEYNCWQAMYCYWTKDNYLFDIEPCSSHPCQSFELTDECLQTIIHSCQSAPQFVFPQSSVSFLAEVDIIYDIQYLLNYTERYLLPAYVCFRNQRCAEFLSHPVQIANKTMCQRIPHTFGIDKFSYILGDTWFDGLLTLIRTCIPFDRTAINTTHCRSNNLIHCQYNQHCISKYRLIDGTIDCYSSADETDSLKETSCSIKQNNRFQCVEGTNLARRHICISPILIRNGNADCLNDTDELDLIEKTRQKIPPFSFLCDSFVDIDEINNETDETHCEEWSCDNVYTRCDGIWHCLNGLDEANCKDSVCPPYTHPCLLPTNNTMICLPLSKINDKNIDCRGATDERSICHHLEPYYPTYRYKCWNESTCIDVNSLCNADPNQPYPLEYFIDCKLYEDDEQFCSPVIGDSSVCDDDYPRNRTIEAEVLCNLTELYPRGGIQISRNELYLSLANAGYYPSDLSNKTELKIDMNQNSTLESTQPNQFPLPKIDFETAWYCNRGIYVMIGINQTLACLCPPSYYGPRCQYQNQRVSLTLQFRTGYSAIVWRTTIFHFLVTLIDEDYTINSYEQIIYVPIRDCNRKFQIQLLYRDRPKNMTKNYTVKIDAFIKNHLSYYASWQLSIPFLFLPVNRLASILTIPITKQIEYDCTENICGKYGRCIRYVSSADFFCQCDIGWKGRWCHIKQKENEQCQCSLDSLCIQPGLCLCPLNKFGSRCYLTQFSCKPDTCSYRGLCVSDDQRISEFNFTCICNEGYWGHRCEYTSTQIDIHFIHIPIPEAIHIHLIKTYENNLGEHERITTFKRIPIYQDFATIQISPLFNILFIEFDKKYYLAVLQEKNFLQTYISTEINPSQQCKSIDNLLNKTQLRYPILHRVKYYHLICRIYQNLVCFYDNIYMCLCNDERQVNCFTFDHNMTYNCHDQIYCKNNAQCYQDHLTCPTKLLCVCSECFFGSRCQLSTKDFSLSIDTILAYHIKPNVSFLHQRLIIKIVLCLIILIFCLGLINGLLSTMTFQIKQFRQLGCGIYLLTSSIVSFFPLFILLLKFLYLILSQTNQILNRTHLLINCIIMDFFLQISLNMGNWLNACVAMERMINICQGAQFNKRKSKRIAKWLLLFLILFIILTTIHDPFHRQLIDDEDQDDRRILCIINYSLQMKIYDLIMNIIHFFLPFCINIISSIVIIVVAARKRTLAQKQFTYKQHLRKQFHEHKHLLISPIILIILALPRLIISFMSGCLKSIREPWLFLAGYFISFLPSISIFIIFVLPSETYRKELMLKIRSFPLIKNVHQINK